MNAAALLLSEILIGNKFNNFAIAVAFFFQTHFRNSYPSGKPGVDGGKALSELAANLIPDTTTIIVLPALEREAKNSAWFSELAKCQHFNRVKRDCATTSFPIGLQAD